MADPTDVTPEQFAAIIDRMRSKALEGAQILFDAATSREDLLGIATIALYRIEQFHLALAQAGHMRSRESMDTQVAILVVKSTLDLLLKGAPIFDARTLPDQLAHFARKATEAGTAHAFAPPKEKTR